MFTAKNYIKVNDLEEAYRLNQSRNSVILGGILWLKMGNRPYQNAIDLSALNLDQIEENDQFFSIGCMTSLRDLEINQSVQSFYGGVIAESLKHIVGVQFRNCATVGGTIFGRFGFSDLLTCLLILNTSVELYRGGMVPLAEFIKMPKDRDILVRIIIQKEERQAAYGTHRMTATDFPVLACAVSRFQGLWQAAVGARPSRAVLIPDKNHLLSERPTSREVQAFQAYLRTQAAFGSNMRGSALYREHLAGVLIRRGIEKITGGTYENKTLGQ